MSRPMPLGGLYFSAQQLQLARENRDQALIRDAIALLESPRQAALETAALTALRWQFTGDDNFARSAAHLLQRADLDASLARDRHGCQMLLAWLSSLSMLRGHESWRTLHDRYAAIFASAAADGHETDSPLDALWLGALQLGAGIVFQRADATAAGQAAYRRAVDQIIHPEGFLKGITDVDDADDTYAAQVSGSCALTLMAEMAAHASLDLWSHDSRGVTPVTASAYLLYYYFYPERWKWSDNLTRGETVRVMREQGAFIEMVHRHSPLRGAEQLLAEMRPLFSPMAGGLTTLTHSQSPARKRRWSLF